MGYTHYWTVKDYEKWISIWEFLVPDVRKIVQAANVELSDGSDDESLPAVIDEEKGIDINGRGDLAHEQFHLERDTDAKMDFTKTARKPYDLVVATILIRAKVLMKAGIVVESDGTWDDDWLEARQLYASLWPEDILEGILGKE
ncbi:hypothetical protein BU24DRAFT_425692 [Aaosphaeria arxii CBS 175.79]|uniref:Uncharacterized protein n=1 Tax=Aaosphaeria arxii CBS 175.79 TaxID=1450172 RepID=A0A6A5XGA8_9PLEO|nr:uncharacterized protein BU24DRAFT_425692 [Aaosphaeria arxii CBS 175.79]KAF2011867.1 hypothetical protein BU24DRAFT_425692 [Aaosphaeria arxii CBS 175.79]